MSLPFLPGLTFLHPAFLAALLALPLLWYLLRVTPPAPRRVFFPAARFLLDLTAQETTPSKTPWWILLLRLLIAALIIIALARPVFNQADTMTGSGPLRLVLDTSWAAAQTWPEQTLAAEEILSQAERSNRPVLLLTTAPLPGDDLHLATDVLSAAQARPILKALVPRPWPADYAAARKALQNQKSQQNKTSTETLWLSHGLDEGGILPLVQDLQAQGTLTYLRPDGAHLPALLRPAQANLKDATSSDSTAARIDLETPRGANLLTPRGFSVQAQGQGGQTLDAVSITLPLNQNRETARFTLSPAQQNTLAQFRIAGTRSAGGVFLLDDQAKKKEIGLMSNAEGPDSAPLVTDTYFLRRALEPYATLTIASLPELLEKNLPMLILPDVTAMPPETLNALEDWVKKGGLLLRFSGPAMAQSQGEHFLLPVSLRAGGRSLSGAMTWEKPQTIAPFEATSPLFGLSVPEDITIRQQILADPAQDLSDKVWAQLSDGTPLITASPLERGLIVLIHTTAGPEWSDLPLSGLYVNILRRITNLAGSGRTAQNLQTQDSLDPILIMDGFGALGAPDNTVEPLPTAAAEKTIPSAKTPPGLYARGPLQYALNLGTNLPPLRAAPPMPAGVVDVGYARSYEYDLTPVILCAAVILFLLDWAVILLLAAPYFSLRVARASLLLLLCALPFIPAPAHAADIVARDIEHAGGLYLAYIITGDASLDDLSHRGLENLAKALTQRTSVEPSGVVGLNPETDTLAFFPILYWPLGAQQKPLSASGLKAVQDYLDHGGTILFDTRDENRSKTGLSATPAGDALRRVLGGVNIPPLEPIPDKHVLGQSFYLLSHFPGRYEHGTFWIEQDAAPGRDGVSAVMIGSNDWASAWASFGQARRTNRFDPTGANSQGEMAIRFGVNLVMYALTGNYKADQVHIPFILERLGR